MDSFTYPSDPKILDPLMEQVTSLHGRNSAVFPSPPSREQLGAILDCAFSASLSTDEGRGAQFTIAFFGDRQNTLPYQLESRIPLSPRALVRLSGGLDAARSPICIASAGSSLEIAGFWHMGEQNPFHGASTTLSVLLVRVVGPGVFLIRN